MLYTYLKFHRLSINICGLKIYMLQCQVQASALEKLRFTDLYTLLGFCLFALLGLLFHFENGLFSSPDSTVQLCGSTRLSCALTPSRALLKYYSKLMSNEVNCMQMR